MLLQDKVVLITGSTTGIGAAIAREAIAQGAWVMVHGRHADRAQTLVAELGERSAFHLADLSDVKVASHLVDATVEKFGRIDVLINNAGIYPRNDIDDLDETFFDWVVDVNLKSPMFLCQSAVKYFRKNHTGGSIVNIGSINAHCGQTNLLVYSATKGGLMTMTRNLGDALGNEGIRVNQLNVGWTKTETEDATRKERGFPDGWDSKVPTTYAPTGKLLYPDDIARHAVFWASDYSAPANGQVYELEQYPLIGRNLLNHVELNETV
ncbi:MAG: oxidoreductase [Coxiellaceae bacterium]|nr:oxidoreductase [Coxiellaceae bacterium]